MTAFTNRLKIGLLAAAVTVSLAACGTRSDDRTESGAAIGAGTGAVIGGVFGLGIGAIPGALIGGAVGAGTGAVTTANQVDLGTPVWRSGGHGSADADTNSNEKLSSN